MPAATGSARTPLGPKCTGTPGIIISDTENKFLFLHNNVLKKCHFLNNFKALSNVIYLTCMINKNNVLYHKVTIDNSLEEKNAGLSN